MLSRTNHVGLLATPGTVNSGSYTMEIHNISPNIKLTAIACPMWVPLVEYGEHNSAGADYFIKKRIDQLMSTDPLIDTIILGCTHYPLLIPKIRRYVPDGVRVVSQGKYVASSLVDYLRRHEDMRARLSTGGTCRFLTTESADKFSRSARVFMPGTYVEAEQIELSRQ